MDPFRADDDNGGLRVTLVTPHGEADARWHPAREGHAAVLLLGGERGGWTSPAGGMFAQLAEELPEAGVAVLHLCYREPGALAECRMDARTAVGFLRKNGYAKQGVVAHGFGGAVAIQVAAACEEVRSIALLGTQAYGAEPAAELGPRCSLLLVHGSEDRVLPPQASAYVHSIAAEPKRIVRVAGGTHTLDEHAPAVQDEVRTWLDAAFPRPVVTLRS